jgi:hypothetical protein
VPSKNIMKRPGLARIHFPTGLGLLILLVAIGVGVYLVRTRTSVKSEAEESATPKQVQITNITDTSFTVSWISDAATTGSLKYGTDSKSVDQQVLDERDKLAGDTSKYEVHYITVKELTANTKYYFRLVADGKQFDNNGSLFEVTTGALLGTPPAADPVYGKILKASGQDAEGVVVYVSVAGGAPLSALAKNNGNWALSLSTARTADLASYLSYDTQATIENIRVQGASWGVADAVVTTLNDSPVPDITLGQSYDFRSLASAQETTQTTTTTENQADTTTSNFNLQSLSGTGEASQSGEVTLENPSFDGEVINATQPAFIGSGPAGTVLSIEINSETGYTGSVAIDENGEWEFIPPEGLEPGEHTVTIAYIDSQGLEQTISRSFVIAAAGESDQPAITATPSGETEPSPSATPTATPTASPAARTSMPATSGGVPEPGSLTPTWLLLIMGIGFLLGGAILKAKI